MGSSPSAPTDLRPSPATTPYHKKSQMFLSTAKAGVLRGLIQDTASCVVDWDAHGCWTGAMQTSENPPSTHYGEYGQEEGPRLLDPGPLLDDVGCWLRPEEKKLRTTPQEGAASSASLWVSLVLPLPPTLKNIKNPALSAR